MFKKLSLAAAALAMGATALVPTAAEAQGRHHGGYYQDGYYGRGGDYGRGGYYPRYNGRNYNYYRAREKCNDGDGGTIVGAIAGGLLGNTVAGRGDRTIGTLLGGAVGAVAGRAIDRSDRPGYCRR
jgi:hypothetical protein